jgi:hypothetical protein
LLRRRSWKPVPASKKGFMTWIKTNLKNSFVALLGGQETNPDHLEERLDAIREFMLLELGESAKQKNPRLVRMVTFTSEVQDLWYARGELMAELSALYGETLARQKIAHVTKMFKGMLPKALNSRPSTLTRE